MPPILTIEAVSASLPTEADAYKALEQIRWCGGVADCPHCASTETIHITSANGVSRRTRTGFMSQRRLWVCAACFGQFSVLTGSVLHGCKFSQRALLGQVASPLHIRGLMRTYGYNGVVARRVYDKAESIRADGLVQVRPTDYAGLNPELPEWVKGRIFGHKFVSLNAPNIYSKSNHERLSTDGLWDDPTFEAAMVNLHDVEIEHQQRLWEWNQDHASQRPRPIDTTDLAAIPAASNGFTTGMASRHRGRVARSHAALNNPGGQRKAKKPRDKR